MAEIGFVFSCLPLVPGGRGSPNANECVWGPQSQGQGPWGWSCRPLSGKLALFRTIGPETWRPLHRRIQSAIRNPQSSRLLFSYCTTGYSRAEDSGARRPPSSVIRLPFSFLLDVPLSCLAYIIQHSLLFFKKNPRNPGTNHRSDTARRLQVALLTLHTLPPFILCGFAATVEPCGIAAAADFADHVIASEARQSQGLRPEPRVPGAKYAKSAKKTKSKTRIALPLAVFASLRET